MLFFYSKVSFYVIKNLIFQEKMRQLDKDKHYEDELARLRDEIDRLKHQQPRPAPQVNAIYVSLCMRIHVIHMLHALDSFPNPL